MHVLFILPSHGSVPQETLDTASVLTQAGARVTYAGYGHTTAKFDPVSVFLAVLECLWSPTLRLLLKSRREGTFRRLIDLDGLRAKGHWEQFARTVDAVVVPGGHGQVYARLVRDPRLAATLG